VHKHLSEEGRTECFYACSDFCQEELLSIHSVPVNFESNEEHRRIAQSKVFERMLINLWVHVMNVWTCSVPQVLCLRFEILNVTRIDEEFVESCANSKWFSTRTVAPPWPSTINDSSQVFWHSECANFQRCSLIDNSADDWPNFPCIQTSFHIHSSLSNKPSGIRIHNMVPKFMYVVYKGEWHLFSAHPKKFGLYH
jgi:hypothetical protein